MEEFVSRFFENLMDRMTGPMKFRLVLQPLMAVIFAVRDGRKDAHEGKPAYLWAIFAGSGHRHDLFSDGWKAVGKIFLMAIAIDMAYQLIVLRWFYPGEALVTAAILALIPYLLIRGPVNRIARRM